MTTTRQAQKKRSRVKNDITTMQLTQGNKTRLKNIQQNEKAVSLIIC